MGPHPERENARGRQHRRGRPTPPRARASARGRRETHGLMIRCPSAGVNLLHRYCSALMAALSTGGPPCDGSPPCSCPSSALAAPAAPGADAPVPDEARLRAMTARFVPVDIGADVSALPGERAPRAREDDRGGARPRRPLPPPGLGRQRGAPARAPGRPLPARPGPAPRLPRQQGAVVPARPRRRRSCPACRRSRRRPTSIPPAPRRPRSRRG